MAPGPIGPTVSGRLATPTQPPQITLLEIPPGPVLRGESISKLRISIYGP